jgi:hypothetical protein
MIPIGGWVLFKKHMTIISNKIYAASWTKLLNSFGLSQKIAARMKITMSMFSNMLQMPRQVKQNVTRFIFQIEKKHENRCSH